jgi:surface polysaccharide O-acyltransferase-like enzyme
MSPGIDIGEIIFYALNLIFLAWPVILLAPLRTRRNKLRTIALLWVFLAVIRPIYAVSNVPKFNFIIGEPLYTVLFALIGFAILLIWSGSKWPFRKVEG